MSQELDSEGHLATIAQSVTRQLIRRVSHIPDQAQRVEIVRAVLLNQPEPVVCEALSYLAYRSARRRGAETWLSVMSALNDLTFGYEKERLLYRAAKQRDRIYVSMLLLGPECSSQQHRESPPMQDLVLGDLSLGERKTLAKTPDLSMLDRLLFDQDISVLKVLLNNPRLTEKHVLRLVSHRPNRKEVIQTVTRSHHWITRRDVQLAVVLNPYTSVKTSVLLCPLLTPGELRDIMAQSTLHHMLREAARDLVTRKPQAP